MHSDARLLGYEEADGSSEIETGSRFTLGQEQAHIRDFDTEFAQD